MTPEKRELPIRVHAFDRPEEYDRFLQEHRMGSGYGSRAKGILNPDGSIDVAIDKPYYLQGGIKPEQLPALAEHERIELTSNKEDPHLAGTIGEYRYILDHFGAQELRDYHTRLCNLMGGVNDTSNRALTTVLGEMTK